MRITCDSSCRTCNSPEGRTRSLKDNFMTYYCERCSKAYFCEHGVVKSSSISGQSHYCPICSSLLINKTISEVSVEKGRFKNIYSSLDYRKPINSIGNTIQRSDAIVVQDRNIVTSLYFQTLMKELSNIDGLTAQIISNFALDYGISETFLEGLSGSTYDILSQLASKNPNFIEDMYSILINKDNSISSGISLRFTVFSSNIPEIFYIQPSKAITDHGPYDLVGYNSMGQRIWIFTFANIIDKQEIEDIIGPMLNQEKKEFFGLAKIYFVAKDFSYVAKRLIKKYKGIVLTEENKRKTVPFELWKEQKTKKASQILFEKLI